MRPRLALALVAVCGATPAAALADGPKAPPGADDSFEQRLVRRVAAERGLELMSVEAAAGRTIARIEVVAVPVFTPADPIPDVLNVFHVTTREHVVRQELLFAQGDAFDPERIEETARNLRSMVVLTTASVEPFRAEGGDVGVLVVTKDLWTLRHGFVDLFFDPARFSETLRVRGALTEMNLLGLNKSVAIQYARNPWVREIGQTYLDRRVLGSSTTLFWPFLVEGV